MSPPVNNVPPLAHALTVNTGLQGGRFNQCSTALGIFSWTLTHWYILWKLDYPVQSLCLCCTWMCGNSQ